MDGFGEGMSKSKGNGLDPLDIIDLYGTDAMRYGMVAIATETQDSRLPVVNVCPHCGHAGAGEGRAHVHAHEEARLPSCKQPFRPGGPWTTEDPELKTAKQASDRFEVGRNFANKLWNATRFILMNLDGYTPAPIDRENAGDRRSLDREPPGHDRDGDDESPGKLPLRGGGPAGVRVRLDGVLRLVHRDEQEPVEVRPGVCQRVLVGVLDGILRLVHPVMPFVAESLWQALNEAAAVRGFPAPKQAEESGVHRRVADLPGLAHRRQHREPASPGCRS